MARSSGTSLCRTVMEVQRCANIAPFNLFHRNYHATILDGYYIPVNSTIMMNLFPTLLDPNCFQDPYAFKPERFLTNDGELSFEKMHGLYPYGLGKRICMGESTARCELFTVICAFYSDIDSAKFQEGYTHWERKWS